MKALLTIGLSIVLLGMPLRANGISTANLDECISIYKSTAPTILSNEGWTMEECIKAFQ